MESVTKMSYLNIFIAFSRYSYKSSVNETEWAKIINWLWNQVGALKAK